MIKHMQKTAIRVLFFILLLTSACSSQTSGIIIKEPWARMGIAGGNSAIYLQIENSSSEDDALLSASCNAAMMTELHMTRMMEDGTMKMEPQEKIPVPAGQTVELKPGGLHVMLMNLKQDLKTGNTITLKLKFEKNGVIEIQVPVKEP